MSREKEWNWVSWQHPWDLGDWP